MPRSETVREYTEAEQMLRQRVIIGNNINLTLKPQEKYGLILSINVPIDDIDIYQENFKGTIGAYSTNRICKTCVQFAMVNNEALRVAKTVIYDLIRSDSWRLKLELWETANGPHN